jgi:hypothetical protein
MLPVNPNRRIEKSLKKHEVTPGLKGMYVPPLDGGHSYTRTSHHKQNEAPEKHIGAGMRIAKPLVSVDLHEIGPRKTIPIDL